MDLKKFYHKMREVERAIAEAFPVIVTQETSDGGRAGQLVEVTRSTAARLVAEGRARFANEQETADYRDELAKARAVAEKRALAQKVQVHVIADSDLRALNNAPAPEQS